MEDAFIISCHPETQRRAEWMEGKNTHQRCSICTSLHPYEFVYQLLNGGFIRGWLWENGNPVFCETDGGLFYASHLLDMTEEWLFSNALEIFKHTGVAYYWDREDIHMWAPYKNLHMGYGSALTIDTDDMATASALVAEKYYNRRLP